MAKMSVVQASQRAMTNHQAHHLPYAKYQDVFDGHLGVKSKEEEGQVRGWKVVMPSAVHGRGMFRAAAVRAFADRQ